jgi:hypothetical protein
MVGFAMKSDKRYFGGFPSRKGKPFQMPEPLLT